MKIIESPPKGLQTTKNSFHAISTILKEKTIYLMLFIAMTSLIIGVGVGVYLEKDGHVSKGVKIKSQLERQHSIQKGYGFKSAFSPDHRDSIRKVEHEHLHFVLKDEAFNRLKELRIRAIEKGYLFRTKGDTVKTRIKYRGKVYRARLRLKGDMLDHLAGRKWSFRVKIGGQKSILGMDRFSLQSPRTRNYIHEWMFMKALEKEGLIALRYHFVRVSINGRDWGIYALEEHFGNKLLGHNRLKTGPILKFDETHLWINESRPGYKELVKEADLYQSSRIAPFQSQKYVPGTKEYAAFKHGQELIDQFRRGKKKFDKVFDVEKMSKFAAMADLMGAHHSWRWHNLRFYFNPVTGLLEPIGFDANASEAYDLLLGTSISRYKNEYPFKYLVFKNLNFIKHYVMYLESFSRPGYLENLVASVKDEMNRNLAILRIDSPEYRYVDGTYGVFAKKIITSLRPARGANAFLFSNDKDEIVLSIANVCELPIEILNIERSDGQYVGGKNYILTAREFGRPPVYGNYSFLKAKKKLFKKYSGKAVLRYRILGTSRIMTEEILKWTKPNRLISKRDLFHGSSDFEKYHFIELNEAIKEIRVRPGKWTINERVSIPAGYTFVINGNTTIDLVNSAFILSSSPVRINGNSEGPVLITSSDSTGQGLAVIRAKRPSIIHHAIFKGIRSPQIDWWGVSGGVSFYESPVTVSNTSFIEIDAEDALSIVRSNYEVRNSAFKNIKSDGLDTDFSDGLVVDSHFNKAGNDAIDLSGGRVSIKNVNISEVQDKAVSVGEDCSVQIDGININASKLGIVSKDSSLTIVNNAKLSDTKYGFCAFHKKSEYGPGQLDINDVEFINVKQKYVVEKGSGLVVKRKAVETNGHDFKALLFALKFDDQVKENE
jgi:hypothetical protein